MSEKGAGRSSKTNSRSPSPRFGMSSASSASLSPHSRTPSPRDRRESRPPSPSASLSSNLSSSRGNNRRQGECPDHIYKSLEKNLALVVDGKKIGPLLRIIVNNLNGAAFIGFCEHEVFNQCTLKFPVNFLKEFNLGNVSIRHTMISDFSDLFSPFNCREVFSSVTSLTLSFNNLMEIPLEIFSLTKLEVLDLKSNSISVLPPIFFESKSLKKCFLDSNSIASLPYKITEMDQLLEISIDDNPLKSPPKSIFSAHDGSSNITNATDQLLAIKSYFNNRKTSRLTVGIKVCTFHQFSQQRDISFNDGSSSKFSTGSFRTASGRNIEPSYNCQDCSNFENFKQLYPKQAVYVVYPGTIATPPSRTSSLNLPTNGRSFSRVPSTSSLNSPTDEKTLSQEPSSSYFNFPIDEQDATLSTPDGGSITPPSEHQGFDQCFRYVTSTINNIFNHQPFAFVVIVMSNRSEESSVANMSRKLEKFYQGYCGESNCVRLIEDVDSLKSITVTENSPTILVLAEKSNLKLQENEQLEKGIVLSESRDILDLLSTMNITFSSSLADWAMFQSNKIDMLYKLIKDCKPILELAQLKKKYYGMDMAADENFGKLLQCLHDSGKIVWLGPKCDYIFRDISFPAEIVHQFRSDFGGEAFESSYYLYLWALHFINTQVSRTKASLADFKSAAEKCKIKFEPNPNENRDETKDDDGSRWTSFIKSAVEFVEIDTSKSSDVDEIRLNKLKRLIEAIQDVLIESKDIILLRMPSETQFKEYFFHQTKSLVVVPVIALINDALVGSRAPLIKSSTKVLESTFLSKERGNFTGLQLPGIAYSDFIDLLNETSDDKISSCWLRSGHMFLNKSRTMRASAVDLPSIYKSLEESVGIKALGDNGRKFVHKYEFQYFVPSNAIMTILDIFYDRFVMNNNNNNRSGSIGSGGGLENRSSYCNELNDSKKMEDFFIISPGQSVSLGLSSSLPHFRIVVVSELRFELRCEKKNWFIAVYYNSSDSDKDNDDEEHFSKCIVVESFISDNVSDFSLPLSYMKKIGIMICNVFSKSPATSYTTSGSMRSETSTTPISQRVESPSLSLPPRRSDSIHSNSNSSSSNSGGGSGGGGSNARNKSVGSYSSSMNRYGCSNTSFNSNLIISRKYMCPSCLLEKDEALREDDGEKASKVGELNAKIIDREEESLNLMIEAIKSNPTFEPEQRQRKLQEQMRSWLSKPFTCSLGCDVDKRELIAYSADMLELERKVEEEDGAIPFLLLSVLSSQGVAFDEVKKSVVKLTFLQKKKTSTGETSNESNGSGVAIKHEVTEESIDSGSRYLYILTAAHVLWMCLSPGLRDGDLDLDSSIKIEDDENKVVYNFGSHEIIYFNSKSDLMLTRIKLPGSGETLQKVAPNTADTSITTISTASSLATPEASLLSVSPLSLAPAPFVGQIVRALGYPDGDSLCCDVGYIEKLRACDAVVGLYTSQGFSGGPLLDSKGRVIGVLSKGLLMKSFFCLASGIWENSRKYIHQVHFKSELKDLQKRHWK